MSDEEIDEMFNQVDTDGSGAIEYSEFVVASMRQEQLLTQDKLAAAFKMFDKDGGGTISIDEIKTVLIQGNNVNEAAI